MVKPYAVCRVGIYIYAQVLLGLICRLTGAELGYLWRYPLRLRVLLNILVGGVLTI